MHLKPTVDSVGSGVAQNKQTVTPFGLNLFAHLLRMKTADLKYIIKCGLELKRYGQRMLLHVIVSKREYVMDRYITAVDNALESDPECLLRNLRAAIELKWLVCEFELRN